MLATSWSVRTRLLVILLLSLLAMLALETVNLRSQYRDAVQHQKQHLQRLVDAATSQVHYFYQRAEQGILTEAQAREQALEVLNAQQFGKDGYFFVLNQSVDMIGHGQQPAVRGKNFANAVSEDGVTVFSNMSALVTTGQSEGAFFEYQWRAAGESAAEDKISYVKAFAPWGWVVGSGVYLADIHSAVKQDLIYSLGGVAIIGSLLLLIALWLVRSIVVPLHEIEAVIDDMAAANLSHRVTYQADNELGRMGKAVNTMLDSMVSLIHQLSSSATQLHGSAQQLSAASLQSHKGSTDQVNVTHQMHTGVESLLATIDAICKQSAETTTLGDTVNERVHESRTELDASESMVGALSGVVGNTASRLRSLETDTAQIAEVMVEIESISEQTNLLALNAAIEAARAGESGRGFAVVADEVRKLASRTRTSTDVVRQAIERLQSSVDSSVKAMEQSESQAEKARALTEHAVSVLAGTAADMHSVHAMTEDISQTTEEQTVVAGDIDAHVKHIMSVTSEVNEATEMVAANAEQLSQLAETLHGQIQRFQL